jgi:hypothetical protein
VNVGYDGVRASRHECRVVGERMVQVYHGSLEFSWVLNVFCPFSSLWGDDPLSLVITVALLLYQNY